MIDLIKEGVELEHQYAIDTMQRGILGLNSNMMHEYLKFIGNRRLACSSLAKNEFKRLLKS